MKTEIMKSLKRFGGAALVASMLLTSAIPAVIAEEGDVEAAQDEETNPEDEEVLIIEDSDDEEEPSEENPEENTEENPEENPDENAGENTDENTEGTSDEASEPEELIVVDEIEDPHAQLEVLAETMGSDVQFAGISISSVGDSLDALLSFLSNVALGEQTTAEDIRAMANKLHTKLTADNSSLTIDQLDVIIRNLSYTRNVLNNNKGKANFKSADVKAARSAVTQAIEAASSLKEHVETHHTDSKPSPSGSTDGGNESTPSESSSTPSESSNTPSETPSTPSEDGKDKPSETPKPDSGSETKPSETKPAEGKTDEDIPVNNDDGKGLLDYIKDIIGIVDSGAGAADKVVDVAKKIKDNIPGVSETKEIAEKMTEELAKAGISASPDIIDKAAQMVSKYGNASSGNDGKENGGSDGSGSNDSNSTVTTNDNGTTYINNGGTIIINNGKGNDDSDKGENPQKEKKYFLVEQKRAETKDLDEAAKFINNFNENGYKVVGVDKGTQTRQMGYIKWTNDIFRITGEKRTEITAEEAKDYLSKSNYGNGFRVEDENGTQVVDIID